MNSLADSLGIRSHGIAGATLATVDLAHARIFFVVRLGFPPFVDEADKFATELSIRAEGPFAMTYVHPADDPRAKH